MNRVLMQPRKRRLRLYALVSAGILLGVTVLVPQGNAGKGKLPAPSSKELAEAEKVIQNIYKNDLTKAEKDPEAGAALAQTLFKEALDTTDAPGLRYVTLRHSWELAARGGNAALAFDAIEVLGHDYDVATLPFQAEVLTRAIKSDPPKEQALDYLETALALVPTALRTDDLDTVAGLIE